MKRHFFIDKMNTIFSGSEMNLGNSPIAELNYGNGVSRILLSFDIKKIKEKYDDFTFGVPEKTTHFLCMKNCGSIDVSKFEKGIYGISGAKKERTSSFEIIAFKLPRNFDAGIGSSLSYDAYTETKETYNKNGSNWFQAKNLDYWKNDEESNMGIPGLDNGVYSLNYLEEELGKFLDGNKSVVIGFQHFDKGYENLRIDITDYINKCISGEEIFYGIGLSFAPAYEMDENDTLQYVGFFSNNTNTIFHPYVESECNIVLNDTRMNFHKEMDNFLYLYCNIDGIPVNLDNVPKCTISEKEFKVIHVGKGEYCAVIEHNSLEGDNYSMEYDKWSNLALNGATLDDVEQSFVFQPKSGKINLSGQINSSSSISPSLFNIHDNEELCRGNEIEVGVMFSKEYSFGETEKIEEGEFRIRTKDGKSDIVVFDFSPIKIRNGYCSFMIYTEDFIPGKYIIDIRAKSGYSKKTYMDVGSFIIINDKTEAYK